jgi:hypothetical protein
MPMKGPGCFIAKQRVNIHQYFDVLGGYETRAHVMVCKRGMSLDIFEDVRTFAVDVCIHMEKRSPAGILYSVDEEQGVCVFWKRDYFLFDDVAETVFIEDVSSSACDG